MKKLARPIAKGAISARLERANRKVHFWQEKTNRRRNLLIAMQDGNHHVQRTESRPFKNRVFIVVPNNLSLEGNYSESILVINRIRDYVLEKRLPVMIDFGNLEIVELAAAMVLTAEIDRCFRLGKIGLVNGNYPRSDQAYKRLDEIGFYQVLGIKNASGKKPVAPLEGGFRTVKLMSGTWVDAEKIDAFLTELIPNAQVVDEKSRRDLYACLIEGIKNAFEHSNKKPTQHRTLPNHWWMSGTIDSANGDCQIVVFDQGAGVPATIPPTAMERMHKLLRRIGSLKSDSFVIQLATKIGRTSTGLQGRGKGFATMKKFVSRSPNGELLVYSLCGRYRYASPETQSDKPERLDRGESLGGTLVQWRMQHSSNRGSRL